MARKKDNNKNKKDQKPRVHRDIDGFNIEIDAFGELKSNLPIEKLNKFLNKNVEDKKLQEREDYKEIQKKGRFKKDKEKGSK